MKGAFLRKWTYYVVSSGYGKDLERDRETRSTENQM